MTYDAIPHLAETTHLKQFSTFLAWASIVGISLAFVYGALAMIFGYTALWGVVAASFGGGLLGIFTRTLFHRGQVGLSVSITFIGLAIVSFCIVISIPTFSTSVLFSLIAIFMIMLPLIQRTLLPWMFIVLVVAGIVIALAGEYVRWFAPLPEAVIGRFYISSILICMTMLILAIWQYHQRRTTILHQLQQANDSLSNMTTNLELQVAEQIVSLRRALGDVEVRAAQESRLRQELELQREAIRELNVPVLPVFHDTLVMPMIGMLDTVRLQQIQEQALTSLERTRARRLLLDMTGVPIVDMQVAHGLMHTISAARLLGAKVTLIGVRPDVAQLLVSLGIDLRSVEVMRNLQAALETRSIKV